MKGLGRKTRYAKKKPHGYSGGGNTKDKFPIIKKKKKGSHNLTKDSSGMTYSYKLPSGSSIGFSKNPHSKGINFTSRIGEQSYIDASADDQGSFNIGFRKKFSTGGKL